MDLSHHQSNLSLSFSSSHASPPRRPPIPDDSISLHLESSFRDPSHPVPTVPLQLMEPQTEKENGSIDTDLNVNEEDDREVEEFRILGHSMCLKRRRDCDSSTVMAKRASVERDLESRKLAVRSWGDQPLHLADPDIFAIMEKEKNRQYKGDRIMGLDTPSGGNTSHGYYTPNGKKVSSASIFFESLPYKINPQSGFIDYDKLEERALDFRPKILICGGSSYPREWDYARFRHIADKCGAVLLGDIAQISGIIAAKECVNPFDYCDVVTSTTHKSLRGPRGGIIFYRKGTKPRKRGILVQGHESDQYDFEEKINFAVFPSLQGGPHNNHIAALAIALKQVATPEYKAYMQQVKKNAQALACALLRRKCRLVTGGTDNHLLLWDLRPLGLTGKIYEKVCEACHITLNKIAIFGDNGTIIPGGVRIGTPAMTSRGCLESDFETMADYLFRAAQIAIMLQREHGKLQNTIYKVLESNRDIIELRARVEAFATQFVLPGYDI
ncbi:unnamed protein product [Lathyrus sativus]|nr:unnamed protein product [Lathyrus sativus]